MKTARKPKAGAVHEGRGAVDDAGGGQDAERVERRLRQPGAAHQWQQRRRSGHADDSAADHLERELLDDGPERAVVARRQLDQPDHERDPDRVVRAGLTLQDRARSPADLAAAEHGEGHGRIGRCECGSEQSARDPGEAEQAMCGECDQPGRGEGAEDAQRHDRDERHRRLAPADVHAAVEEDHDHRDDADPFDGDEGHRLAERRCDVGSDRGGEEEDGCARNRQALGDRASEQREREAGGDDQDDLTEICDLVHAFGL